MRRCRPNYWMRLGECTPATEEVRLTLGWRRPEVKRGVAHDQQRSAYRRHQVDCRPPGECTALRRSVIAPVKSLDVNWAKNARRSSLAARHRQMRSIPGVGATLLTERRVPQTQARFKLLIQRDAPLSPNFRVAAACGSNPADHAYDMLTIRQLGLSPSAFGLANVVLARAD
jgi:hypothetical protein